MSTAPPDGDSPDAAPAYSGHFTADSPASDPPRTDRPATEPPASAPPDPPPPAAYPPASAWATSAPPSGAAPLPPGRLPGAEVPPEEAGFRRGERPGFGLVLVVLSAIVALGSIVVPWYDTVPAFDSPVERERITPFDLPTRVEELGGESISSLLVPVLLIGLSVVALLLGAVATIGLRSNSRTLVARVVAWLAVQGGSIAYLVTLIAAVDQAAKPFTGYSGDTDYLSLHFEMAGSVWVMAMGALAWSALIGPRVVWTAGPATPPGATVRIRMSVMALVFAGLAAVVAAIGFLAVPWFSAGGTTSTFFEVSDALDGAGSGADIARAYFGWGGFLVLVAVLVAAGLVVAGATGGAPIAAARIAGLLVAAGGVAAHVAALDQIDADSDAFSAGVVLVPAALAILLLAVFLPARTTVRLPG